MRNSATNINDDSDNEDNVSVSSQTSNQNPNADDANDEQEDIVDENEEEGVEDIDNDDNENDEVEDIEEELSEDEDDDDDDADDVDDDQSKPLNKKGLKRASTKPLSDNHTLLMDAMNIQDDDDDESDDSASIDNELQMNGIMADNEEYDDDDDEDPETYFQKFDEEINANYLLDQHPNQFNKNYDEIEVLSNIVRDVNNNIIDPLHKTIPYLTKYERTRVLGQRAKQINSGSKPYVQVPDNIMDGYIIAQMELVQKRIPFIIQRPVYGGSSEYWKLKDLELLI